VRILVDMDGVLSDYEGGFLRRWRDEYPDAPFVRLSDRTTFYIADQYGEDARPLVRRIVLEPGFISGLQPIHGSVSALNAMDLAGFEVYICSSPLSEYRNCVSEKYEWIEKHLGGSWVDRMIVTKDKTLIKADILIDDKPSVCGVEDPPPWEHIVYDQPYNRQEVGKRRLTWNTWEAVLMADVGA
jgi:5'-nucleotidase